MQSESINSQTNWKETVRQNSYRWAALWFVTIAILSALLKTQLTTPTSFQVTALFIVGGMSLVGALSGLLVAQVNSSKALANARLALAEFEDKQTNVENQLLYLAEAEDLYEAELTRLSHWQAAHEVMNLILEQVATSDSRLPEEVIIQRLFMISRRSIVIALGFRIEDIWAIKVYQSVNTSDFSKGALRCIAAIRAIEAELSQERIWPVGVGVAGTAFSRGAAVIVPDLLAIEYPLLSETQKTRRIDSLYRSFVADPISLNDEEPWGVLEVATNRADHFNTEDSGFVSIAHAIAGFVRLAIQINRSRTITLSEANAPDNDRVQIRDELSSEPNLELPDEQLREAVSAAISGTPASTYGIARAEELTERRAEKLRGALLPFQRRKLRRTH